MPARDRRRPPIDQRPSPVVSPVPDTATPLCRAKRDPGTGAIAFDLGLPWSPVALAVYVAAVLVTVVFGLLHAAALVTGHGGDGAGVVVIVLGVAAATSAGFFFGGLLWRRRGGHLTIRLQPGPASGPGLAVRRRNQGAYRSPDVGPRFEVRWRGQAVDEGALTEDRLTVERFDVPRGRFGLRTAPRFALVLRSRPVAEPWRWRVGVERQGYDLAVAIDRGAVLEAARHLAGQLGLDPHRIGDEGGDQER